MKKLWAVMMIGFLLIPMLVFGAGTVTQSIKRVSSGVYVVTISWTGDASDGSVPSTALNSEIIGQVEGCYLYSAETNPGSGPPTANYDIVLNDADGVDIAASQLLNRHTSTTELVNLGMGSYGYPVVRTSLTFVLTNNSQASAAGTVILTFVK